MLFMGGWSQSREDEAGEALFAFYCASLSFYSRFQSLILLAYVTCCGRRHEAHALYRGGKSVYQVADALGISPQTATRWLSQPLPRVPSWARRALEELEEYGAEDVVEALSEPWGIAC
jgi:hypothetical protein